MEQRAPETTAQAERAADALVALWRDWADRIDRMAVDQWQRPTRCEGWTVQALAAHATPDPDMLAALPAAVLPGPAAMGDAADLLREFNRPGGVAHTMAPTIEEAATATASELPPEEMARRFRASAEVAAELAMAAETVVPHPVVGSVTVGLMVELGVMEATVHLLDLIAAVGGPPPAEDALAITRNLLARVADPVALIEAATGRTPPGSALPVIR